MLINLRDICAIAEQENMAIGQFNAPSFEAVRAVLDAAERTGFPVILAHAEAHESYMPLDAIGPAMVALAERASVPVCVHLDHGEHLSYIHRALEMGFSGVMYDGSMESYEVNMENSKRAAVMCATYGAGLECELGSMGSREGGQRPEGGTAEEAGVVYTDPELAAEFAECVGLDILACSFGTVHGLYKGEPQLFFDVLHEIRKRASIPLVMHGGSGVSDEDYRMAIDAGIRKINYYTYGAKFAGEAACEVIDSARATNEDAVVYWHDLTVPAYERLLEDFTEVINTFSNGAQPRR